jgi:AcrR family transcriptional regulator
MTNPEISKTDGDSTRERILVAAEEVFAEKGFNQATVREILKRADVGNIAAINYHFGDKERLYVETVKNAHACCNAAPFPAWPEGTSPEQKLRDFISTLSERMLKPLRVTAIKVVIREMVDPTIAFAEVVSEYIEPMAAILRGILSEMLPDVSQERIFMIGNSIVGQGLFYRQNRPIIERLMGKEAVDQLTPEILAAHITEFTLAALRGHSARTAAATPGNQDKRSV